jgi:hypothetical protein
MAQEFRASVEKLSEPSKFNETANLPDFSNPRPTDELKYEVFVGTYDQEKNDERVELGLRLRDRVRLGLKLFDGDGRQL